MLDLRYLVSKFWRYKIFIFLCAVLGGVVGIGDVRNFGRSFEAYMVIIPKQAAAAGQAGQSNKIQGIANTFGITIGGGGDSEISKFDEFEYFLQSVTLAERLQKKYSLAQKIWHKKWDSKTGQWIRPKSRMFEVKQHIRKFFKMRTWSPPDLEALAKYLGNSIEFRPVSSTADIFSLSYRNKDAELALFVVKTVFSEVERHLKEKAQETNREYIAYLEDLLSKTKITEIRLGLVTNLSEQQAMAMMLASEQPFAATILEQPNVSTDPQFADPFVMIAKPTFGALIISLVLVAFFVLYRRE